MTIVKKEWHYYSIFDVNESAFEDIKRRLYSKQLAEKYMMVDDEGRDIIVFGTTALRAEKDEQNNHSG
jgi:hypothetical protein